MIPIFGPTRTTLAQAHAWMDGRGAHQRFKNVAPLYYLLAPLYEIPAENALGQASWETNDGHYTGQVEPHYHNWCGLKTKDADGDEPDDHQQFASDAEGVEAHLQHIRRYGNRGLPPGRELLDPRWHLVTAFTDTIEGLGGSWAPSPTYGNRVSTRIRSLTDTEGPQVVHTEYDHIFGEGFFHEDLRPILPHEPSHGPNRKIPLDQKNLGVIWHYNGPPVQEGDFDRQHILNVGQYHVYSANFGRDPNNPLHQDKIAYHIAVDDHARAYLLRDLDDMSWHCGETAHNMRALAIYFPIGGDQRATDVQLAKGVELTDRWLTWSNVDRKSGLKGHQEVSPTDCPGTLMPEIVRLRQSEVLLPPLDEAKMIFFEEQGYRITLGFMDHFLELGGRAFPEDPLKGGIAVFGYPKTDEYATPFGSAQEFERYFMEWHRDNAPPFDIIGTLREAPDPEKAA